tara:strand:+ start:1607 stop:1954 length:348 start_codon:yes stop_codon:yes gene_type:complete
MMSNVKSAKAKGRRLQNFLRDELKKAFPALREDDIKSQTMGMCGEDIVLSPIAQDVIGYSFECKNKERLDLWASLEQAEDNCNGREPVLVFKRNRSKTYVALDVNHFLELIRERQ